MLDSVQFPAVILLAIFLPITAISRRLSGFSTRARVDFSVATLVIIIVWTASRHDGREWDIYTLSSQGQLASKNVEEV